MYIHLFEVYEFPIFSLAMSDFQFENDIQCTEIAIKNLSSDNQFD